MKAGTISKVSKLSKAFQQVNPKQLQLLQCLHNKLSMICHCTKVRTRNQECIQKPVYQCMEPMRLLPQLEPLELADPFLVFCLLHYMLLHRTSFPCHQELLICNPNPFHCIFRSAHAYKMELYQLFFVMIAELKDSLLLYLK